MVLKTKTTSKKTMHFMAPMVVLFRRYYCNFMHNGGHCTLLGMECYAIHYYTEKPLL